MAVTPTSNKTIPADWLTAEAKVKQSSSTDGSQCNNNNQKVDIIIFPDKPEKENWVEAFLAPVEKNVFSYEFMRTAANTALAIRWPTAYAAGLGSGVVHGIYQHAKAARLKPKPGTETQQKLPAKTLSSEINGMALYSRMAIAAFYALGQYVCDEHPLDQLNLNSYDAETQDYLRAIELGQPVAGASGFYMGRDLFSWTWKEINIWFGSKEVK